MKTKRFLALLAAVIFMAMASFNCAPSQPGDPDNPIDTFAGSTTPTQVVEVSFVYDEELAYQAEQKTDESAFISMVKDEIDKTAEILATGIGIKPAAVTPDFPPGYVAIGGDAVVATPACKYDPYNPACRIDISSSCASGVCNASITIPIASWRVIWFFYAGQIQVGRMSLTSAQMTPNTTYYLANFMTIAGDTIPNTSPLHKTWPGACVRVDRPTSTTIEVNRGVAAQTKCQDTLFAVDFYAIGDSGWVQPVTGLGLLDDDLLAWTGVNTNDGDQKIKSTLLPPTVVSGSTLFPRLLWNVAATPAPAYTHTFASVTSGMSYWIGHYSHDRGLASDSGQIAPLKGGDYIRTRRYDTASRTFVTTPSCGGTGYGIELVNMLNLNYLTPATDPFYVLQVQSTNPTTYCPVQGADTRPVIFGFGT
jgi:hypothetical protein